MESKRSNNDDNALQIMQSISNELKSTSDNFERANLLRQAGVLLFRESAKSSEVLASFALKDVLNSYSKVVTSTDEGSVNNYTGEVARLLKTAHSRDVNKWSTTINSFDSENLLTNKKCQGDYEDCKHREVSYKDLEKIRKSKTEKSHEPQTLNSPISSKQETHSYYVRQPTLNSGPDRIPSPSGTSTKQPTINSIFKTAREEFTLQSLKKLGHASGSTTNHNQQHQHQPLFSYGASKRSLGFRRTIQDQFVPPVKPACQEFADNHDYIESSDDRLKHIDPKMIELISSEIMSKFKPVAWDDIAGLEYAKSIIQEAVVWPLLRPDIFTGLRRPPRGILLFGPPGTGKTLIGKCIASQSKSTFFSISSSSLTSKWIGDGEKMVRALFAVAAVHQPSVIFIDEVDSLLCQRSATEHESSRRLKTEFLVQLDGAMTSQDERILIVGATNRPQELDEAARRRFIRRLYIPLPEIEARIQILRNLLCSVRHTLSDVEIENVGKLTEGYSGADMESVCREASMEPIRSIPPTKIMSFNEKEVRSISFDDFYTALNRIKASVSQNDLQQYHEWNEVYGSGNVR